MELQLETDHTARLQGGLPPGSALYTELRVPAACQRFSVNLECGPGPEPELALHFNPRQEEGQAVLNSRAPGRGWGEEERHPLGS